MTHLSSLSKTELSSINWNFHDADTSELTHGIHRYSGKYIPQIARQAIELLTVPGDLIYDPYCGSGTTLLESALLGRRSTGVDLNPLAVLISETKVTPVEPKLLNRLWSAANDLPLDGEHQNRFSLWGPLNHPDVQGDPRLLDPWFTKWYPDEVLLALVAIDRFSRSFEDSRLRNISLIAMSEILRKVSRAHQGFPNVMFDKQRDVKVSVRNEYLSRLRAVVNAVESLTSRVQYSSDWIQPTIRQGNAEDENLKRESAAAVITHPPYIGSIPYAEYGQLSIRWLGHDPGELDRNLTGGVRQSRTVVSRFRVGYLKMLRASANALRPGGHLFLLTGNPVVKGEVVNLFEMTIESLSTTGLTLAYSAERSAINRRANKMGAETVSIWRKL